MNPNDRYDSLIEWIWEFSSAKYKNVDADWRMLKELIRAESAFNPRAISPVGARGLCQIMAKTWNADDFERHWDNPELNIQKGCAHLLYLWNLFKAEKGKERWAYALGAYNAGQGWIIKAQALLAAKGKPTDQWSLIVEVLPLLTGDNAKQTIAYVDKIMKAYGEYSYD